MILSIIAEQPPLASDANDVIRVGGTRVTLDTVIEAFNEGLSAEEIVQQYPTLRLAHIYGTISYYLNHKADVDNYIAQRKTQATITKQQNEARFDMSGLRSRLLARHEE